ncbi:type VI secretion system tip protein TssI/VgrG [uncultured Gilvimarinus sp.]|uniref:type VI secretion system Vgr family protein n=1 Tax=uncultured Gilvimarinus sp. TaxID=1689143 RepID=UPI0030DA1BB8
MERIYNLISPLDAEQLRFSALQGRESLSQLFQFDLTLTSPSGDITPADLLGQALTLEVALADGGTRHLNGQCTEFQSLGKHGRQYLYRARLRPWLWYATQRQDYRIFQNSSVPDMVKQVLVTYPFECRFNLCGRYRNWEYCVQYRESDANFVMRLLEHEGIWFYFEHSASGHTLVMTDDIGLASPAPAYAALPFQEAGATEPNKDFIDRWHGAGSVTSGSYQARDYNFEQASALLDTQRAQPASHPFGKLDVFDYPGSYPHVDDGEGYAKVRVEELRSPHQRSYGKASARGIAPGRLLTLEQHPQAHHNQEYLMVACDYDFQANDYEADTGAAPFVMQVQFEAHPSSEPYRPARLTRKPLTHGPDSAVVSGPAGEEIYTDEHGRVKVHFHWDRYSGRDQNSSCWIRVSHPWAGAGFGGIHVPRIGQEVLVDYLNGDPDRPVITSRVYNNLQPAPWSLPANATQSGFLTRSTPKGTWEQANAFRFEDKIGQEQIWLHAQKNQDIEVNNDETHWVGNDRTKTIDRDETTHIKRDRTETVDGNETITVHKARTEEVDGDETITVHRNRQERVDKNETISIGDNRTEEVGKNESITIGDSRSKNVANNETVNIGVDRSADIGKSDTLSVGKNATLNVGGHHKASIGKTSMQTVALARMDNVGAAYSLNVGALMNTIVGLNQTEQIGQSKTTKVKKNTTINTGEDLVLEAGNSITLQVGKASLVLNSNGNITLVGNEVTLEASGPMQITGSDIDLN